MATRPGGVGITSFAHHGLSHTTKNKSERIGTALITSHKNSKNQSRKKYDKPHEKQLTIRDIYIKSGLLIPN